MKYRRKKSSSGFIIIGLIIIAFILVLYFLFRSTPESQVKRVVDDFYQYEQESDFGNAWELFHPFMRDKFTRRGYIQDRNHVFMGHFDVSTFSYTIGDPKLLDSWKMSRESDPINEVYQIPITQTFKSKFGTFTLSQDVFVAKDKEDGDWSILWSYE
ncbi:hypothetical protein [Litchfieldia salsa]|uniref:Uncharacterized protein n=1 Tax=Litchfieldia salsa TaxID=930152 RepID=A0A1H0U2A3_9BACI|nr:hypothetical protein [Litchfieldia salsa]SDP59946.1 hypothetical protein SAMN05216565_10481 [Litchfieldia salsa]